METESACDLPEQVKEKTEGQAVLDTETVSDEDLPSSPNNLGTEAISEEELVESKSVSQDEGEADCAVVLEAEEAHKSEHTSREAADSSITEEDESPGVYAIWRSLQKDPSDFSGWTKLLFSVNQTNNIKMARMVYDSFLERYPYCYGYWRKYADYERSKGEMEMCLQVYHRGLKAIPLSVDLWLHYLHYCKINMCEEKVREQYTKAVDSCGLDFKSDCLWDSFIQWEMTLGNILNVSQIYDRLLQTPTLGYSVQFQKYKAFLENHPTIDLVNPEEYSVLLKDAFKEVFPTGQAQLHCNCHVTSTSNYQSEPCFYKEMVVEETSPGIEEAAVEETSLDHKLAIEETSSDKEVATQETSCDKEEALGGACQVPSPEMQVDEMPSVSSTVPEVARTVLPSSVDPNGDIVCQLCCDNTMSFPLNYSEAIQVDNLIKKKILVIRQEYFEKNKNEVNSRLAFENAIKRPYFHVKPQEKSQLSFWRSYLEFEINRGDRKRIIVLFERCLIACACYIEFWLRFLKYLDSQPLKEVDHLIRHTYERVCLIHHPDHTAVWLGWASFEEGAGNIDSARRALIKVEEKVPHLLVVALSRINLERRDGNLAEAEKLYKQYLESAQSNRVYTTLALKFSKFASKVLKDHKKAANILYDAIKRNEANITLYFILIDLLTSVEGYNEKECLSLFNQMLSNASISQEKKMVIAQRKVEFMEEFCSSPTEKYNAQKEYAQYLKNSKSMSLPKKDDSENVAPSKKMKMDLSFHKTPPTCNSSQCSGFYDRRHSEQNACDHRMPPPNMQYSQHSSSNQPYYNYGSWNYSRPGNDNCYNNMGNYYYPSY